MPRNDSNMSQEEINEVMRDYDKVMTEYHNELNRKNNRMLKALTSVMGNKFVENLKEYMEDSEGPSNEIRIVKNRKGSLQKEIGFGAIKKVWVNQWDNGGYTGDSFSGDIYIPITKKRFVTFGYSM